MRYILIILLFVGCGKAPNSSEREAEKKVDSVVEISNVFEGHTLDTSSSCLNIFDGIDNIQIKELCSKYSTSSVLGKADNGSMNGSYTLLYKNKSGAIMQLGELEVLFSNKPWLMFCEDEQWKSFLLLSDTVKINDYLYVGQNINLINNHIVLTEFGSNKFVYKSDCEKVTIETEEGEIVSSIRIERNDLSDPPIVRVK